MIAVVSVDAYPFLALSDLTCHLEDMGICVFWLYCVTKEVRRPNLEEATKKFLHQQVQKTWVNLVPCSRTKCHEFLDVIGYYK